jgi:hypothetical protein
MPLRPGPNVGGLPLEEIKKKEVLIKKEKKKKRRKPKSFSPKKKVAYRAYDSDEEGYNSKDYARNLTQVN